MKNSWWQELMRFFLQGMTLKHLIHMIIILIILVIITPEDFKEWVNLRNPEIIPPYWMYYTLLFCSSYVINCLFRSSHDSVCKRLSEYRERRDRENESQAITDMFDSLSLKEKVILACAVDANNTILVRRGDETALSLDSKGLLSFDGKSLTKSGQDKFYIPQSIYHDCYIRFAGKLDYFMDELIKQENAEKLAVKGP